MRALGEITRRRHAAARGGEASNAALWTAVRRVSRRAAASLALALWLAVIFAPAAHAEPQLHTMAVSPADASKVYGGSFLLEAASTVTNSEASSVPAGFSPPTGAVFARHGRITGYLTFLGRPKAITAGLVIFSDIDWYRTDGGPRWAIRYLGTNAGAPGPNTPKRTAVHGVGEAAYITRYNQPSSENAPHVMMLAFRRRNYLVTIGVGGRGTLRVKDVLRLAQIVDRRLKSGS